MLRLNIQQFPLRLLNKREAIIVQSLFPRGNLIRFGMSWWSCCTQWMASGKLFICSDMLLTGYLFQSVFCISLYIVSLTTNRKTDFLFTPYVGDHNLVSNEVSPFLKDVIVFYCTCVFFTKSTCVIQFFSTRSNLHFKPEFTSKVFKKFQLKIKLPQGGVKMEIWSYR